MISVVFKTLIVREIKRFLSVYNQTLVAPVISAFLYFTIFSVLFSARGGISLDYKIFIASGLTIMAVLQNAYANTQSTMTTAKVLGFYVDFIITPISSFTLLMAFLVGGIFRGLVVGILSFLVFIFLVDLHFYNLWLILTYAILGSALFSFVGIIVGSIGKNFDSASSFNTYLIMPLTLLSGTFYSVKMLPEFWQKIIYMNPVFYIIDGFRYGITGISESPLGTVVPILNLFILVFGFGVMAYFILQKCYHEFK